MRYARCSMLCASCSGDDLLGPRHLPLLQVRLPRRQLDLGELGLQSRDLDRVAGVVEELAGRRVKVNFVATEARQTEEQEGGEGAN